MQERIDVTIKDNQGKISTHSINVGKNTAVKCPKCKGDILEQAFTIHRISRLLVGSPTDLYPRVPVVYCVRCGTKITEPIDMTANNSPIPKNVLPMRPTNP